MTYKTGNKKKDKTYNFQNFKTLTFFGRWIYSGDLTLNDAFEEQINFKKEIDKFREYTKPQISEKEKKALTFGKSR